MLLFCAPLALLAASCRLLESQPPFQYLSASLVVGPGGDCHRIIGLHYRLRNDADRAIASFHISFRLYDGEGNQLPLPGDNLFDVVYESPIPPECERSICANLDGSFHFEPQGKVVVEGLGIYRVDFADGGVWRDRFDLYRYPYEVVAEGTVAGSGSSA